MRPFAPNQQTKSIGAAKSEDLERLLLSCHRWLTLCSGALCMIVFHAVLTSGYKEQFRYELSTFVNLTPKSILLLSGIFLSSTSLGSRWRLLTALTLLPSFGFVVFATELYGYAIGLAIFGNIIWSYWIVLRKVRMRK